MKQSRLKLRSRALDQYGAYYRSTCSRLVQSYAELVASMHELRTSIDLVQMKMLLNLTYEDYSQCLVRCFASAASCPPECDEAALSKQRSLLDFDSPSGFFCPILKPTTVDHLVAALARVNNLTMIHLVVRCVAGRARRRIVQCIGRQRSLMFESTENALAEPGHGL